MQISFKYPIFLDLFHAVGLGTYRVCHAVLIVELDAIETVGVMGTFNVLKCIAV